MQRRGGSEQPVKGQSANRPEARNAPTAQELTDHSLEQFDRLKHERDEALEQLAATSEVLQVISSSPGTLEPVFQAMLENAQRICEAKFGTLYLCDGDALRPVADTHRAPLAYIEARKRKPRLPPVPDGPVGGVLITKQVVHVADLGKLQSYLEHHPTVVDAVELGGFRTALGVPMLRDNELIGLINIMRQEVRPFTDKQIKLVENFAAEAVIAIENARLLNELRESLQQQTATADVLKVISRSTFDLPKVLNALVESAAVLCQADKAQILRPTGKDASYYSAASYGHTAEYNEHIRTQTFAPGRGGVVGRVLLEGKSVQIPDVFADPEYTYREVAGLGGYRTILGVPLLREGNPIGLLVLHRVTVRPFTQKQIELVETFADQAVIAIENVRLFDEVQARTRDLSESLQQQTATADVLKVISRSTFDLPKVLNALVESAAVLCQADKAQILRPTGKDASYYSAASYGHTAEYNEHIRTQTFAPGRGGVVGRVLLEGKSVQIPDVFADPEYTYREVAGLGGYRTILGVPLLREGNPIGLLVLHRVTVRPFTQKQIELVETFADQAVIAIENVRLFDEVQARTRDLSESLQQQTATADVLKVISSSPGQLEPVFRAMLENAVQICSAKFGNLWLREGDAFRICGMHGAPPAYADYMRREPVGVHPGPGTVLDCVVKTRQVVHIADVRMEDAYAEGTPFYIGTIKLACARTVIGVPMLKDNDLVGAIVIYRQEVQPFTDKQIDLVKNFAAQAVIAIENTRLLKELRQRTDDLTELLQQQTATSEVLKVISSSPGELEPVFGAILENATRICDASYGIMFLREGTGFRTAAIHNLPHALAEERRRVELVEPIPDDPLSRLAATKQRVHMEALKDVSLNDKRRGDFRRDLREGRFTMEFAQSGDVALQRITDAAGVSLILILTDINMPGMTGLELLPKAKAARPDVPVIMITAYGDAETKQKALERGAEALFTKPIDFGALRSEIDTRVERAA